MTKSTGRSLYRRFDKDENGKFVRRVKKASPDRRKIAGKCVVCEGIITASHGQAVRNLHKACKKEYKRLVKKAKKKGFVREVNGVREEDICQKCLREYRNLAQDKKKGVTLNPREHDSAYCKDHG